MNWKLTFAIVATIAAGALTAPAMAFDGLWNSPPDQGDGGQENPGQEHPPGQEDPGQDDHGHKHCDKDRDGHRECHEGKRIERFNLVCYYEAKENAEGFKFCKAASTFLKRVTAEGGEVADRSPLDDPHSPFVPHFEVECDQRHRYEDSAVRDTDLLSTTIVGQTGPHPVLYLPRGALNVGDHVSSSNLEVEDGREVHRLEGRCYIWNGDRDRDRDSHR